MLLLRDTHQYKHTLTLVRSVPYFLCSSSRVNLWSSYEEKESKIQKIKMWGFKTADVRNECPSTLLGPRAESTQRQTLAASMCISRHANTPKNTGFNLPTTERPASSNHLVCCEQTVCWGLNQCRPTDTLTLAAVLLLWRISTVVLIHSDGRHQNDPKSPWFNWVCICYSHVASSSFFPFRTQQRLQQVDDPKKYSDSHLSGLFACYDTAKPRKFKQRCPRWSLVACLLT